MDQDKRRVAFHEAGHVTVAAAYGIPVKATVDWNDAESRWQGQARLHPPMLFRRDKPPKRIRKTKAVSTQIGVAGIIAEGMYQLEEPYGLDAFTVLDWWEGDILAPSDTDIAMMSKGLRRRANAIDQACTILERESRLLEAVAKMLLEEEYISDGDVDDLASELLVMNLPMRKDGKLLRSRTP